MKATPAAPFLVLSRGLTLAGAVAVVGLAAMQGWAGEGTERRVAALAAVLNASKLHHLAEPAVSAASRLVTACFTAFLSSSSSDTSFPSHLARRAQMCSTIYIRSLFSTKGDIGGKDVAEPARPPRIRAGPHNRR